MPPLHWASALALALLVHGCGSATLPLNRMAEDYVRVALQVAQHQPDLVEAWRGDPSWRPGPRVPVAGLLTRIEELQRRLGEAAPAAVSRGDRARHQYLRAQLRGLRFAAQRQLGRTATIDEQFREEFELEPQPVDGAHIQRVRDELDLVLPGAAPLADRVAALRRRTTVPNDRRLAVIDAAIAACRRATTAVIPLPPDEGVRIVLQPGLEWDGFARYDGSHRSELQINDDAPLDVARAWRLACHEGYPGHHVQHVLIDVTFPDGDRPELDLTPAFGRHLLLAEGAAEVGADLALTDDERLSLYRDVLFPAAGLTTADVTALVRVEALLPHLLPVVTAVARQYLDGSTTQDQAIERLADDALVANPAGTLAFIERRRARALVYGEGRRAVRALLQAHSLDGLYALFTAHRGLQ